MQKLNECAYFLGKIGDAFYSSDIWVAIFLETLGLTSADSMMRLSMFDYSAFHGLISSSLICLLGGDLM